MGRRTTPAKPVVLNFLKDLIVFLPPLVHWEGLTASGMMDLHVLPRPFPWPPFVVPNFGTDGPSAITVENVVMGMLRPVSPA